MTGYSNEKIIEGAISAEVREKAGYKTSSRSFREGADSPGEVFELLKKASEQRDWQLLARALTSEGRLVLAATILKSADTTLARAGTGRRTALAEDLQRLLRHHGLSGLEEATGADALARLRRVDSSLMLFQDVCLYLFAAINVLRPLQKNSLPSFILSI